VVPAYLTDAEIADLCRPLRQPAAQLRYLRSLGIPVQRRRDGTPLVWRRDLERASAGGDGATMDSANEPRWTRHA
jgi:hypothetical protein